MVREFRNRIKRSETYRLLTDKGLWRAAAHLGSVFKNACFSSLFVDVSGYIAEADLNRFPNSEKYWKEAGNGLLTFHRLTNGEQLPSFCYGITEDEIKRRTNAGHRYYVIQESGKIVCSCWIGFGTVSYGGPSIYLYSNHPIFDLEPGHAWLYDIICQDEHRGKGLGTMLYREILRDLGSEGISLVTATVGEDNIANIKVLLRSDFILKEFVRYRRWLIFRCRNRKVLNEKDLEFLRKKLGR